MSRATEQNVGRDSHGQFGGFFEEWDNRPGFLVHDMESETGESTDSKPFPS